MADERVRPTIPGWYWIKHPGYGPYIVELIWEDDNESRLAIWESSGDEGGIIEIPLGSDFRGPIPNLFDFDEPAKKSQ